jgi:hypothetical protein
MFVDAEVVALQSAWWDLFDWMRLLPNVSPLAYAACGFCGLSIVSE